MYYLLRLVSAWLLLVIVNVAFGQDGSRMYAAITLPDKFFTALDKKTASVESKLDKQTDKYLSKMQKQENKLRKKIWRRDSALAKQIFDGVDARYEGLKKGVSDEASNVYSGHLDSLTTALNFLKTNSPVDNPALQKSLNQYNELQSKFNATEQVKNYISRRRELLKQQFQRLGMVKQLRQYRKQVYYYQHQVQEYKKMFEDPNKMETKLMEVATKFPQFRDFFAKNSMLSSMFALPGSNTSTASIAGLQTRALLSQTLADRFGSGANVTQILQQNVQSAQGQLAQLKNRLASYKNGGYGDGRDDDVPRFNPNNERTKSFLQRLEYGGNVQSQKARYFFPVTSDLALSLGYKINGKSTVGIGASYKLGWGNNWNNVRLSHQGVGLRSYLDCRLKGSFYFSGGYEQNYRNTINSVSQLKEYSAWQSSGLIGLSKKYSISKKMNGEIKLLWDFMSYQQVPKAQPVLFRVGYSLK